MARSQINVVTDDLISDSGAILWSFVLGEQLEFPIVLNFVEDAADYTFEAVVMEANNVLGQEEPPTDVRTGGVNTTLTVRLPDYIGVWDSQQAYNMEEIVSYDGLYYKLLSGAAYTNATTPDLDENWELTTLNKVYVQFPSTLGATWTVKPKVNSNVYGWFELRVTEAANAILQKTWKPVRGMVELHFSPTELVP